MGEKRRITRLSRITYMFFFLCRITGCNPAHFGVIRVLSVPSGTHKNKTGTVTKILRVFITSQFDDESTG